MHDVQPVRGWCVWSTHAAKPACQIGGPYSPSSKRRGSVKRLRKRHNQPEEENTPPHTHTHRVWKGLTGGRRRRSRSNSPLTPGGWGCVQLSPPLQLAARLYIDPRRVKIERFTFPSSSALFTGHGAHRGLTRWYCDTGCGRLLRQAPTAGGAHSQYGWRTCRTEAWWVLQIHPLPHPGAELRGVNQDFNTGASQETLYTAETPLVSHAYMEYSSPLKGYGAWRFSHKLEEISSVVLQPGLWRCTKCKST